MLHELVTFDPSETSLEIGDIFVFVSLLLANHDCCLNVQKYEKCGNIWWDIYGLQCAAPPAPSPSITRRYVCFLDPSGNAHLSVSISTAIGRLTEASSLGAFHNSGERFDPPKCHPNTRQAILNKLLDWLIGKVGWDSCFLWLYGPAGAGKSAIAQTFAEQCYEANDLLASFFFSRSDPNRNNGKVLVATLAYQISSRIPGFWRIIETIINNDPSIFRLNFETQFQTLILGPFLQLASTGLFQSGARLPYLLIIDGLDECKGLDTQRTILNTISNALQHHRLTLPFMFLIASRPEHHLTIPFADPSLSDLTLRLALDDTYHPDADIRLYLIDSFRDIRKTHIMRSYLPESWPSQEVIAKLVAKSSGQFIYAATVARYISSPRHSPQDRLKVIHGLLPSNNDRPYAQLDALYTSILSGVEDIEATLRALGISLVLNELSPVDAFLVLRRRTPVDDLERFMLLAPGTIKLLLLDLPSVVDVSDDSEPIKFLHASFTDFLFDPSRSLHFYLNPSQMHEEAAYLCIAHVNSFSCSAVDLISRASTKLHTLEVAFFSLVDHLQHSGSLHSNAVLREKVLNLSYVQSFKNLSEYRRNLLWKPKDTNIRAVFVKFLKFLQTSDFCHTEELYLHHRGVWNQMMREDLAVVPQSRGLAFWIACLISVKKLPEVLDLETIMALPSSPEAPQALLYVPLSFFTGETHLHIVTFDGQRHHTASRADDDWFNINPDYLAILKDFLTDPTQSGPYAVNESTYIMAAEFVVAFAIRPWDEKKKRLNSDKNQWDLIWDAFVSILSRAGRSKELVSMLSRGNLTFCLGRPIGDVWGSLRSMFRAVSDYLLRCTGSTLAGFRIIIDWTQWQPSPGIEKYLDRNIRTDRPFYLDRNRVDFD